MPRTLRAIRAILGASAGLNGEQGALLHFGRVPVHAMDGRRPVHEFMEGKGINFGDFLLSPIMANCGSNPAHGAAVFIGVVGIAGADVVGVANGRLGCRWRWGGWSRGGYKFVDDHVRGSG